MKYFGYLKGSEFKKANERELADFLINNGLFVGKHRGKNTSFKDGIIEFLVNPDELVVDPSNELQDEFYSFIIDIFKYDLALGKLSFFKSFNDEIFGLDGASQKMIALNYFNTIYNEIYLDIVTFFEEQKNDTGITHNYNFSRLKMLSYQYKAFKSNLLRKMKINQYLAGNKEYFIKENLLNLFDLTEEIYFETQLQILVELNDRFGFEEDLYFTQIRFDKINFEKYKHIFHSLESYQFTNNKIKSFSVDHKAHIESLYQVLIELELITNHKENFMKFLNDEYGFVITKIINYDNKINYNHDARVTHLKLDWSALTSKK